jgi:ribosome biogenesis protein YTM1
LNLDKIVPFEFLVKDEMLCSSLGSHISTRAISTEGVLEIEYFPAALPPTPRDDFVHDDWISCVSAIGPSSVPKRGSPSPPSAKEGWVLASGCYDGLVKFWNDSGEVVRQYVAHDYAIKSCAAIGSVQYLTTADDGSVHVWDVARVEGAPSGQDVGLVARLAGHRSSVECSSVRPDGERCVTSGWDKEILVWKAGESLALEAATAATAEPSQPGPKRKKRGSSKPADGSLASLEAKLAEAPALDPIGTLSGHTQAVSGLKWVADEQLVSCSWDHSVKVWDVEMETVLDSFTHNKVIYCVDTPNTNTHANVIAFGGAEKGIRLWDRRESQKQTAFTRTLQSLESHTRWVSDIQWHPTSEHTILSASFDGSIKLWDVRATIPLWTMGADDATGEEDKLFCCTWIDETSIAFGGTARTLSTMRLDPR